ncbi:hypothetical protein [Oceanospirillum maris]|uniref:hypothetical protein n=1 Tax=Oceanospirillum maris TaxID=64977 RepID=UPI0003FB6E3F|nr:hypothetical protein [Oceanospirillum maris]
MCDRPTRLRKAILGMTAFDDTAPEVTTEEVRQRWAFLGASGYTPFVIAKLANGKDVDKDIFEKLMRLLRSHL